MGIWDPHRRYRPDSSSSSSSTSSTSQLELEEEEEEEEEEEADDDAEDHQLSPEEEPPSSDSISSFIHEGDSFLETQRPTRTSPPPAITRSIPHDQMVQLPQPSAPPPPPPAIAGASSANLPQVSPLASSQPTTLPHHASSSSSSSPSSRHYSQQQHEEHSFQLIKPIDIINQLLSTADLDLASNLSHQSLFDHLHPDDLQSLRNLLCPNTPSTIPASSQLLRELCLSTAQSSSSSTTTSHDDHPLYFQNQLSHSSSLRKRSLPYNSRLWPRQSTQGNGSGPTAQGYPTCTAVSNAILSCYPQSNSSLVQHIWSKFIWNNNYPTFIGSRYVDIYLFNAQSETPVANWTSIANDRGMIGIYPDDDWFPPTPTWQNGRNQSYPYFFVITSSGAPLTGGEQHQATFTVVQTAPAAAFIASSIASVSRSLMTRSSVDPARALPTSSGLPNSSLQRASGGDSFPRWEIALIVILGAFALFAFFVAAYLAFNNARRRRQIRIWQQNGVGSAGSVASHSPMIQNTEGAALMGNQRSTGAIASARDLNSPSSSRPGSPLSAANIAGAASFAIPHDGKGDGSGPVETHSADGPITSVDASLMADAFRKALRKPEFIGPDNGAGEDSSNPSSAVHDGHQDDEKDGGDPLSGAKAERVRASMHAQVISVAEMDDEGEEEEEAKEIMDRELASEGRSMTSVDNRKRPEVHG